MKRFSFYAGVCACCLMPLWMWGTEQKGGEDTVYVSSEGDDEKGDGTAAAPFYSLDKALSGRLAGGDTDTLWVLVAAGDYYMQQPLWIQNSSSRPVVIRAAGKEKPRLMGGIRVSGWEKCEGGLYRAYVPEVVRFGFDFEQFYVNGKRAVLARTPNTGWFFVADSREQAFVGGERFARYAVQRIGLNPADFEPLKRCADEELSHLKFRFYHKWDITVKSPAFVERDSSCIYLSGEGMKSWNPIKQDSRYFMYDYKAALDTPGEWYLDRAEGYVYYMPREGEEMADAFCIAPALHQWIRLEGEADEPIRNWTFEHLSFQYAAYQMPEAGEEPEQAAASSEAAVQLDFAENIQFRDCEFLHTGSYALWMRQECHNNVVQHCYLADLGAGGIKIGSPVLSASGRRVTSHNCIENNIITSAGHELPCGVGVALFHTADNTVTHNEISDLLYSGVSVGWIWGYAASPSVRNRITYNHIHHIGWGELSDMGAVYTLGISPGTSVSHNVIHDVYSYDYGGWGLYTDEGSTDIEMSNNLVYRCKSGGFHQHYGENNRIVNNILALDYTNQLQCTRAEEHLSFVFQHNVVLTNGEDLFRSNWATARIDADYNLYWDLSGKLSFAGKTFKEWKREKEPHSVMRDPLFTDPLAGDFTLKSKSAVKKIGFKPFDYTKAGVYGEEEWIEKARLPQERQEAFRQMVAEREAKK